MRPIVLKFGGTSVADAAAIRRVVDIVRHTARREPTLVVVSAMAGITDLLLSACKAARDGSADEGERILTTIRLRHETAICELFGADVPPALSFALDESCRELESVLASVRVLRELTPRAQDRVAASGELMSSRILAAALADSGAGARWVDARTTLITDGTHGAATPLFSATESAVAATIRPVLETGQVAVLGGFIGATAEGITTTLGRGGSDYSAAILGSAMDASEIQIWTDVDGMLTADPRVVADARLVPHLSFGEASELAYFGAKVLHPSTILPAVERGIPVRILNTMRPDAAGSLITQAGAAAPGPLTAIACKRQLTVVDVTSTRMLMAHGFLRRLFEVFERHRTSVDVVTTSEISVSMTLDDDRRIAEIEADLSGFAAVRVERQMAIVTAVGDQLCADPTLGVKVVAALDGLPLRMVSQAASRRNLTVVLRDDDVGVAMARLHDAFFGAQGRPGTPAAEAVA